MAVLVLEDSDTMRHIIVKNLIAIGLRETEIIESSNGADAIDKLNSENFDLLVLDIIMDGIDGIEVFKEARIIQPKARVVMCSTFSEVNVVKELIDMGIDDFIVKPFTEERLRDALGRNLAACNGG